MLSPVRIQVIKPWKPRLRLLHAFGLPRYRYAPSQLDAVHSSPQVNPDWKVGQPGFQVAGRLVFFLSVGVGRGV